MEENSGNHDDPPPDSKLYTGGPHRSKAQEGLGAFPMRFFF